MFDFYGKTSPFLKCFLLYFYTSFGKCQKVDNICLVNVSSGTIFDIGNQEWLGWQNLRSCLIDLALCKHCSLILNICICICILFVFAFNLDLCLYLYCSLQIWLTHLILNNCICNLYSICSCTWICICSCILFGFVLLFVQGGFFNWSALKMTKYEEKLKYLKWSANCSSRKVLSVNPQ